MTKNTVLRKELAGMLTQLKALPYFQAYGRKKLLRRPMVETRLAMAPDNFNLADLVNKALSASDIRDEDHACSTGNGATQSTRVSREKNVMEDPS